MKGSNRQVVQSLLDFGQDIDATDFPFGDTALHYAALHKQVPT